MPVLAYLTYSLVISFSVILLSVVFLPIIFGIYLFVYIIKGYEKGAVDLPLRTIAIQLAISTIVQYCLGILFGVRISKNLFQSANDDIFLIYLISPLAFQVPSLLTSYIWSLKNVLSSNNYFQLYPFVTNFLLILINWGIPYACSTCIYIYFLKNNTLLSIPYLIIDLGIIGVSIFGFRECILIKNKYGHVPYYDNNRQIKPYMTALGGFIISFIIYFIIIHINFFQTTINTIIMVVLNFTYFILQIIFSLSFCYTFKKKTTTVIEEEQLRNPLDSIIQENEIL